MVIIQNDTIAIKKETLNNKLQACIHTIPYADS